MVVFCQTCLRWLRIAENDAAWLIFDPTKETKSRSSSEVKFNLIHCFFWLNGNICILCWKNKKEKIEVMIMMCAYIVYTIILLSSI